MTRTARDRVIIFDFDGTITVGDGPVLAYAEQVAERLAPGAGYLAPRGPVREHGMNRWFRRFGEGRFDVDDAAWKRCATSS